MPLLKRAPPFDDPDWIYELKLDGFRALAVIEHGRAQLISRNGHPFASFSALAESISDCLPNVRAVIDGEICSLDKRGRPLFTNLMFRRGNPPCFFAFDLLIHDGKICELSDCWTANKNFGGWCDLRAYETLVRASNEEMLQFR